jgi:O-antigen/teichoic acid export membrane protein
VVIERQYQYALEEDRARQRLEAEQLAQQQEPPKMGWGIFIIALVLSLIADAAELLTAGTLGWFVGLVVDLILLLMLGFSAAGRKQFKKWIWGPVIEKIPILAAIPFIRVGFLIWSFVSSRSEKFQAVSRVATAAPAKKMV